MAEPKAAEKKEQVPGKTAMQMQAATAQNALALMKRDVVDVVAGKVHQYIKNGELNLPHNYSANNAIKSAWLILQTTENKDHKPALEVCTRNSIANALLDMVVQGLNPAKKQGYFIVYGTTLTFQRSYFGAMAVTKMVNPKVEDFAFAVIYKGDAFKYGIKNGKKTIIEHVQELENVKKTEIVGAYCMALGKDGEPLKTEIMTFEEIKQAWKQSKMNPILDNGAIKADSTHDKFTADMSLRTVINKVCKYIINASSDNSLLLERINRNENLADEAAAQEAIDENANKGEILEIEAEVVEKEEAGAHDPEAKTKGDGAKPKLEPEEKPKTMSGTIRCPDAGGNLVARGACETCGLRNGCPAHEGEAEKEKGKTGRMPGF